MKIVDAKFVQGFIRMCNDGWEQGWHERNGGNLSYRIRPEEIGEIKDQLAVDQEWKEIGTEVPQLAGEYFLVTGSGKYFRNVILDPEDSIARAAKSWDEYHEGEPFVPEDHICRPGCPAKACTWCLGRWTYESPVKCACWYLKDGKTMDEYIKNYKISMPATELAEIL